MKARLTDGSVVVLAQDCTCVDHTGPHWLHMDALMRRRNREALERAVKTVESGTCDAQWIDTHLSHFTFMEQRRLAIPGHAMRRDDAGAIVGDAR